MLCVSDPAVDCERSGFCDGVGHDSLLESNVKIQVVHLMEERLADDVSFELEMTDEHKEMRGPLKIPAGLEAELRRSDNYCAW